MELSCAVQHYEWGKIGLDSYVAVLLSCANPSLAIHRDKPYAELWMGTHPNGPSIIKNSKHSLSAWISENPSCLGTSKLKESQLPFLFKVLSVNKALSIQAHPSMEHAKQLHQEHPTIYKDPNHKPELAIALTRFEALCGFRDVKDIKKYFKIIPEFNEVIGCDLVSKFIDCDEGTATDILKACFSALMSAEESQVETQLTNLISRLETAESSCQAECLSDLLKKLHNEFPGDVGCFGIYLLNYIVLQPGQALYLGPNEIHAYISGDCMECMACSDNVVRAGLTPKFKDVETLCNMLHYSLEPPESKLFQGVQETAQSVVFIPPVPDFAVAKITIHSNSEYELVPRKTASIIIVIQGSGTTLSKSLNLSRGKVFFFAANELISIDTSTSSEIFICFQAFASDIRFL